jgi:hypothetical protein
MSCIVLRGRWCNVIVLNVHALSEEKGDDSKESFYEELEQVFDHFLSTILKFCEEILMQNWGGGGMFSNRPLGIKVYITIWIST